MNDLSESSVGGCFMGEREMMGQTYEKQRYLDGFIKTRHLKDALKPLSEKTGVDFFEFYENDYNIPPKRNGVKQEPVRTSISDPHDEELSDVTPYFVDQEGRRYYRYIGYRYNPEKQAADCEDFLMVEEALPKGKILAIFEYGQRPSRYKFDGYDIRYRKLVGCFGIKEGTVRSEDLAVDLTSFWMGASKSEDKFPDRVKRVQTSLADTSHLIKKYPQVNPVDIASLTRSATLPEENRVIDIGVIDRSTVIDPMTQLNILKEEGRFLFADQEGPDKWFQFLFTGAVFSQNEGDKMPSNIRTDLPLGAIRHFLGESTGAERGLIDDFLASALREGTDLRQVLGETRDWVRNRMAVVLYVVRKLHHEGIDLVPRGGYQDFVNMVENKLEAIQKDQSVFAENEVGLR